MENIKIYFLLTLSFVLFWESSFAQEKEGPEMTSYYLHIKPNIYTNREILGFKLYNRAKRNQASWTSALLKPLQQDSLGYLVKVDLPSSLIPHIQMMKCRALTLNHRKASEMDTVQVSYGGVELSTIRLNISSTPPGAEVFLVPNRIWENTVKNQNWQENIALLGDFRVSTSLTETYTYIDQTVFKVIFKLGDAFQTLTHFTRPPAIEKEQSISVQFQ